MGCKSGLYANNSTTQALVVGNTVNFGFPVRRYGCHATIEGGNVVLRGTGYYLILMNFIVTNAGTAAATPTITLYKDGTAYSGAFDTNTIAAGATEAMCIPCIVRETCDCDSTITAVLTGADSTVSNATVTVVKL